MLWIDQNHIYSQVLVHSTVVNSRNSLRYILTFASLCNLVSFYVPQIQCRIEIPVFDIATMTSKCSIGKF